MDITRENIAYRREDGVWTVPKALDGFSEMTGRHHDKGAPFEPLKYDLSVVFYNLLFFLCC